jgi:beta-lactamase regulating signal transducer with metallopeptidase domain
MLPALLDHLWQSTLFALGVALLILMLRRAPAAVRHGLWFSASLKFLIPFAALAAAGALLAPDIRLPAPAAQTALITTAAEPFSQAVFAQSFPVQPAVAPAYALADSAQAPEASTPRAPAHAAATPAARAAARLNLGLILHFVPWLILAIWAAGSAVIAVGWTRRWMRLRKVRRSARPLAWPAPMPVLAAPSMVEPGLLGLWRPVLLLPESLPGHLSQVETAAIIAHEACHLRRRDNLTAALHMVVEVLFWFHPLVWWIGGQLIAERERACDEAVVAAGHDRAVYARSLVESCRLYLQSPLDCVAGASGSNLKARVEAIMTAPLASPLSPLKKTLLLTAGACACATPVAAGLLTPEAEKAVAPLLRTVAAIAAPARVLEPLAGPEQDAGSKPVALARNDAILAPRVVVAATDAAPMVLAQTVAAPTVEQAPPQPARVSEDPVRQPASRAASAEPVDPKAEASAFVQTYAAATAKRQAIARWVQPICVRVVGLTDRPDNPQGTVVRQRIAEVAKELGIEVPIRCGLPNIQIGFTDDPQAMLDGIIKTNGRLLGDASSGTRSARTVTLPVQAWYETNGKDVAANDAGSLKALAAYRGEGWAGLKTPVLYQPTPCCSTPSSNSFLGGNANAAALQQAPVGGPYNAGNPSFNAIPSSPARALWAKRQFINALVIVDLKQTARADLRVLADYAAMLALAQPKSLGECQALPSITDLFASCPGRAAPTGLTPADMAYLHALYAGDEKSRTDHPAVVAEVVDGMAARLADARPVAPAAWEGPPAAQPSSLLELASYSSPDLGRRARDFVQTNARVGQFGYTVRWEEPLCLPVFGLTPEQNDAVKSRINAVGQTLAQRIY